MKLSLRLLVPTLAIVLVAGAAALLSSPTIQAQTPDPCPDATLCVTEIKLTPSGPYMHDDNIDVTITFGGPVLASSAGTSTIVLQVFDALAETPATTTRNLYVVNPTEATDSLTFTYVVDEDADPHGAIVSVPEDSLGHQAGDPLAAEDSSLTLNLHHDAVSGYGTNHKIDTAAPTLTGVEVTSPGTLDVGGEIVVRVVFSELMEVTGKPTLAVNVGGSPRTAAYSSTDGLNVLFVYTVAKGDNGDVSAPDGEITLGDGGAITDLAGNPALLAYSGATVTEGHSVETDVTGPDVTYKAPSDLTVGIRIQTIRPSTTDTDISRYEITQGRLPRTLRFDDKTGYITGRPTRAVAGPTRLTIRVYDSEADANFTDVQLTLPAILEDEEAAVAAGATLPEVPPVDLSEVNVGDAAPSTGLQIALAAAGAALMLGGIGVITARRRARARARK